MILSGKPAGRMLVMTRDELDRATTIALALAIGIYFIWWSLELLH